MNKELRKSFETIIEKNEQLTAENVSLKARCNHAYLEIYKKCEEMIRESDYMNEIAIRKSALFIKDVLNYYIGTVICDEARWLDE